MKDKDSKENDWMPELNEYGKCDGDLVPLA